MEAKGELGERREGRKGEVKIGGEDISLIRAYVY